MACSSTGHGPRCPDCQLHSTLLLPLCQAEGTLTPPWWHCSRRDYRPWYCTAPTLCTRCPLTKTHRRAASSVRPHQICLLMFVQDDRQHIKVWRWITTWMHAEIHTNSNFKKDGGTVISIHKINGQQLMRVRRGWNQYQYQVPTICNRTIVEGDRQHHFTPREIWSAKKCNLKLWMKYKVITSGNLRCSLRR